MAGFRISHEATLVTAREALAASKAMGDSAATEADLWRRIGSLEYTAEALLRVICELTEQ